jgi:hypothetical protein
MGQTALKSIKDGEKIRLNALMSESVSLAAGQTIALADTVKRVHVLPVISAGSALSKITLNKLFDGEFQIFSVGDSKRGVVVESKLAQQIYYDGNLAQLHEVGIGFGSFSIVYIASLDAFVITQSERDYEKVQTVIEGQIYPFVIPISFHNGIIEAYEQQPSGFYKLISNTGWSINGFNGGVLYLIFGSPMTVKIRIKK